MGNVKLCLTPYRFAANDEVQSFFQNGKTNSSGQYTADAIKLFKPIWQPGLDFWSALLPQGRAQGWWKHMQISEHEMGYEPVKALGLYESCREPSICIDLDLLEYQHASFLLSNAARFGQQFCQSSVHALFSLRQSSAREAWQNNSQLRQLSAKAKTYEVHLATFGGDISARVILDAALSVGMTGLTADISRSQIFHYHSPSLENTARWNTVVKILRSHVAVEYEESWEALLFAIGNGDEYTSKYADCLA